MGVFFFACFWSALKGNQKECRQFRGGPIPRTTGDTIWVGLEGNSSKQIYIEKAARDFWKVAWTIFLAHLIWRSDDSEILW